MKISTKLMIMSMIIVVLISIGSLSVWFKVSSNIKKATLSDTKEMLLDDYKNIIKFEVGTVISFLEYNNKMSQEKGMSKDSAMKIAENYIRELRYGQEGYFWCDDSKGNNVVLLGNKNVEGKSRIDFVDIKGNHVTKNILKQKELYGEGYITYWFPKKGETKPSQKIGFVKYFEPYDWIIGTGNYVDDIDIKALEEKVKQASIFSKSQVVFILFVLFVVAISIFISLLMSKKLATPIVEMSNNASKIAKGNLKVTFKKYKTLELKMLSKSMSSMTTNLNDLVSQIKVGAEQLKIASREIHESSENLSQVASEQASSTEEISSTMEEMVSNIQQNTDNSKTTEKLSQKARENTLQVSVNAGQVEKAVQLINEKITIINDITFQTNILALNAAIEAARAGKHGKGFAVVASEVHKLAERSKIAAEEIISLAQNSKELSDKAGLSLSKVIPHIEQTANLVRGISSASIEQNLGAEQVNNGIQQLNQVAQQNVASSEKLASTSEEMTEQAEQLKDAISYFQLD